MKLNPAFSKSMALACIFAGVVLFAAMVRSEATPRTPLPRGASSRK